MLPGILLAAFLVQLFFILRTALGLKKLPEISAPQNRIHHRYSILIAAHNEAAIIGNCLDALLQQDYPAGHFEIIIAADRCDDDTVAIAESYRKRFQQLSVIDIREVPVGISPKKHALAQAIAAAQYGHFLFLDADVRPTPGHLSAINRHFMENTAAVVSLMKFETPRQFWQRFIVFEKLISWSIAGAGIGFQTPVISYGGNWGYTREAFKAVGGFENINHSLSGDDDLMLQKMGALPGQNIAMCLEPAGWTRMTFPENFSDFLRQRRRHFSAGKSYRPALQVGYFLYHLSNLMIWLGALLAPLGIILLGIKLLLDFLILKKAGKLFQEKVRRREYPLFSLLYLLYNTVIGPLGHIGKIRW